jgi:predicted SnoaL-like aldol condensation-catalyzing enzyme
MVLPTNDISRRRATSLLITAPAALALISPAAAETDAKGLVVAFYRMVFEDHRVQEAFDRYVALPYTQHNPRVPDGPAPAIAFLSGRFAQNPQARNTIVRVIAEGDLVAVHSHSQTTPEDRGAAIVDIFRVENGRIVEHWDVIQPVPETSANGHTMF